MTLDLQSHLSFNIIVYMRPIHDQICRNPSQMLALLGGSWGFCPVPYTSVLLCMSVVISYTKRLLRVRVKPSLFYIHIAAQSRPKISIIG